MYNCCIIGFNSSHSRGESCNLLEAVGQTGASIGRGVKKFGVAWDAMLNGKAEAIASIGSMFSMIQSFVLFRYFQSIIKGFRFESGNFKSEEWNYKE